MIILNCFQWLESSASIEFNYPTYLNGSLFYLKVCYSFLDFMHSRKLNWIFESSYHLCPSQYLRLKNNSNERISIFYYPVQMTILSFHLMTFQAQCKVISKRVLMNKAEYVDDEGQKSNFSQIAICLHVCWIIRQLCWSLELIVKVCLNTWNLGRVSIQLLKYLFSSINTYLVTLKSKSIESNQCK